MEKHLLKWLLVLTITVNLFSCNEDRDPDPAPADEDNLVEATLVGTRSAAELRLLLLLSGRDVDPALFKYDVDIYKVVYLTSYKETDIDASGLILVPKTSDSLAMISFQRGTIIEQSHAPSVQSTQDLEIISYAALSSLGYITVVPDMIGFGASKDTFHPYYVEEPTADAVTDNLRAAATLAKEKRLLFNKKLFLAGYSQGGYATMAAHKAIETTPLEDFNLIASFPAAGGYDILSMQEYFFSLDSYKHPFYIAFVGRSYQTYYNEPDLLTDFFNEPYASRIPALFDGIKSPDEINAQLTNDIQALVRPDVLTNIASNAEYEYLRAAFEDNSLTDWAPMTPMFMYHGDSDETVPFSNSQITYQKLIANGASPDIVKLITLPGADHSSGIEPYIEKVINHLQALNN